MSGWSARRMFDAALALGWGALAGARLAQGGAMALPLALQAGLVAALLLARRGARREARPLVRGVAWLSALLPLAMRPGPFSTVTLTVQIVGLLASIWALASLGASFGVAPADRGLVVRGPYRFIRHPAYLGELVSLAGVLVGAPTPWNAGLLALVAAGLALRAGAEEKTIARYAEYARRVPHRWLPGLW